MSMVSSNEFTEKKNEIFKSFNILSPIIEIICIAVMRLLSSLAPFFFRKPFKRLRYIRVLGIETSCDDTGVAALDSEKKILGEVLHSQSVVHTLHGGISPCIAENLHKKLLPLAVDEVLQQCNLGIKDFDAIAVTNRPGLSVSLKAGVEYAKYLCSLHSVPLIPIHHMEAHALTATLVEDVKYPFLSLLVSGGHCILVLVENPTKFLLLDEASDVAPGCLLDKISRRLKLKNLPEYTTMQGGPSIEKLAKTGDPLAFTYRHEHEYSRTSKFSFSGIMTATIKYIDEAEKKLGIEGAQVLPNAADFCASVQLAITRVICTRLEMAMRYLNGKNLMVNKEKALVMSGGVACNEFMRKMVKHICDTYEYRFMVPPKKYCTDNGVMIAWNAIERLKENVATVKPSDLDQVDVIGRSPFGEVVADMHEVVLRGRYVKINTFLDKNAKESEDMKDTKEKNEVQDMEIVKENKIKHTI